MFEIQAAMEAAAADVTAEAAYNASTEASTATAEEVAAAPMCEVGGDPTWHADFTWWMDGIAMLMVGK